MPPLTILADCEILERIGSGAASAIYRARERSDGSIVAIKYLVAEDKERQKTLRHVSNEYDILRLLHGDSNHPPVGIVGVHRLVKKGGPFSRKKERILVMDYVDGLDLRRESRFPFGQIIDILTQVAKSLSYLHSRGYIHGDLKPENIMVDHEGKVTIIDFGFACKSGSMAESIRGTRDYMAPEQLNKGHLSEKTDLYNFGATMYFLLTGRHVPAMIPAQNDKALFIAHEDAHVASPRSLKPGIPIGLDAIVMRCIEKAPVARPSCIDEVLKILEETRDKYFN
jgi:eukaryotic-like serine/threonine-protein kinase